MVDVIRPLISLANYTAPVQQAGIGRSVASSSSSFTAINTGTNTSGGTKNITLKPRRSNEKPRTTSTLSNDGSNESAKSLHLEPLHQKSTITVASSSGPTSTTAVTLPALSAKPKSEAGKTSGSKAAKKGLSAPPKSAANLISEDEPAATEIGLELEAHDPAEEAERQLYQHVRGWHEGRDPYGLASQSYLLREEPVPWWVCKMCKEGEEMVRESGAWLSEGRL